MNSAMQSQDHPLQLKYQKSLKEIESLIKVNNLLTFRVEELKEQSFQQQKIHHVERDRWIVKIKKEEEENKYLSRHIDDLQKSLEIELKRKQAAEHLVNQHQLSFSHERQNYRIALEMLKKQCEDSIEKVNEEFKRMENESVILQAQNISIKSDKQNCFIENKKLNSKIQELNKSYEELKKKFNQENPISDELKQLIKQYRKKIRDLGDQKKQLENKYKSLKSKLISKGVISVEEEELQSYIEKIEHFQKLTEKQQHQMEKIIEVYDNEINKFYQEKQTAIIQLKNQLLKLNHQNQLLNIQNLEKTNFIEKSLAQNKIIEKQNEELKRLAVFLNSDISKLRQQCESKENSMKQLRKNESTEYGMSKEKLKHLTYVNGRKYQKMNSMNSNQSDQKPLSLSQSNCEYEYSSVEEKAPIIEELKIHETQINEQMESQKGSPVISLRQSAYNDNACESNIWKHQPNFIKPYHPILLVKNPMTARNDGRSVVMPLPKIVHLNSLNRSNY